MLSPGGSAGLGLVWQPCSHPLHRRQGLEPPGWRWDGALVHGGWSQRPTLKLQAATDF